MKFYKLVGRKPVLTDMFDHEAWALDNRQLCKTLIGEIEVSTVFLVIDHGFREHGQPVLFETMVFAPDDSALDQQIQRYCRYGEAVAGHNAIVEEIKLAVAICNDVVHDIVGKLQES